MKTTLAIFVFAIGCADLDMDVKLPDVYVTIEEIDGGVDGGIDVRVANVEFGGNTNLHLVTDKSQTSEGQGEETIESAPPPSVSELPLSTP